METPLAAALRRAERTGNLALQHLHLQLRCFIMFPMHTSIWRQLHARTLSQWHNTHLVQFAYAHQEHHVLNRNIPVWRFGLPASWSALVAATRIRSSRAGDWARLACGSRPGSTERGWLERNGLKFLKSFATPCVWRLRERGERALYSVAQCDQLRSTTCEISAIS